MKVVARKIGKFGIIPFKTKNIESSNDDYDVVLTAHYDTHIARENYILSFYSRRFQLNRNIFVKILGTGLIFALMALYMFNLKPVLMNLMLIASNLIVIELPYGVVNVISALAVVSTLIILYPKKPFTADDNTSGVVGLIKLAKMLKENGLGNRVKIVFTDYEEWGTLGAKSFIKENEDKLKDKIIINFDCIGRGSNIIITSPKESELAKKLKEHFESLDHNIKSYPISCSDDKAFQKKGYNAVGLIRADVDSKGNKNIPWTHTAYDTVDNVSPYKISEVIDPVYLFIESYLKEKEHSSMQEVAADRE